MDPTELRRRANEWLKQDPDPVTAEELRRLLDAFDEAELTDRFGAKLEFGTAGLRGVLGAGPNRMNRAVVRRTTLGLARYLKAHVPEASTRGVVVGRDGRRMSDLFAEDVVGVLAAEGIASWVFPDVVPTPLTAFALKHHRAAAAVMVTASHNPPEYNGYKVYWQDGGQIVPPEDVGIAKAIDEAPPAKDVAVLDVATARARDLVREVPSATLKAYVEGVLSLRPYGRGSALRIVYTAMHGVGGRWVEQLLAQAGFTAVRVVEEQHAPNGDFPTVRFPNPEEPGAMDRALALAERTGADLVLANDPDADRLAAMIRDGAALRMLTGNELGVMLAHYLLTQGRRPPNPLVITTIVSSAQLKQLAHALGARYEETLTGFKWIARKALDRAEHGEQFVFGYEEALGYTAGTQVRDKDGVSTALLVADLAAWCEARGWTLAKYLEELQREHGLFVARQASFTFPGTAGAAVIQGIMNGFRARPPERIGEWKVLAVNDYQQRERRAGGATTALELPASNVLAYELDGGSRVTLRPSGTEPKVKYYFELRENPRAEEPFAQVKERAQARLLELERAFLALARERGQPAPEGA